MADAEGHEGRPVERAAAAARPNRILLLVLAAFAVVATLAGVLAAQRNCAAYDPATPEGTVAAYLAAVIDGDRDEAARHLVAGSRCSVTDLDHTNLPDGVRVALRDVQVTGDTARVDVDVATPTGDLFGGSETFERHTFRLTRSSGAWLLTGEPWPMSGCGKGT
jgi:hypothetical protein